MASPISPQQWDKYVIRRNRGWTVAQAAREAGISTTAAFRYEKDTRGLNKNERKWMDPRIKEKDPLAYAALSTQAKRALIDFGYFQKRYFGRIATPWQVEAAETVLKLLATPDKEFVVVNAPPGVGKSTLFTLDLCAWLTCRNRALRGLIGSKTQSSAIRYVQRLKRHLEMNVPLKGEGTEIDLGLALDAEATLADDFGAFKPAYKDQWAGEAFVVAQVAGAMTSEKEPTWSAYGMDSGFLGMRYDFIVWDDLVDQRVIRTIESRENQQLWWDTMAEKRLDPGGLLVLQGQRMGPDDLYRYALDKRTVVEDDDEGTETEASHRKYRHVIYKAHYPDKCEGQHKKTDPYYPEGCLLDPRRLPWTEIRTEQANMASNFEVVYQQEDVDPHAALIDMNWIKGGGDPYTAEVYPGCLDSTRSLAELPANLAGDLLSIATADPSPTKWWSIQWWVVRCVDGVAYERYLMDHCRKKMDAPSFLDWHEATRSFTGLMEEWQARSVAQNLKISYWIVDANAAQRFMLQYDHVTRWLRDWKTSLIPHQTAANKSDPTYGIEVLKSVYRYGLVRLPYLKSSPAFLASTTLIQEVTHWPMGRTDDAVMAQWFLEWHLPRLIPTTKPLPRMARPSWLRDANTWGHRRKARSLQGAARG